MPHVSLSTSLLRRPGNLLLALCLAFAVSNLFSVLPFGNATSGYMPPVPAPVAQAVDPAHPDLTADTLNWEDTCQVIWGALYDRTDPSQGWAAVGATALWLAATAQDPLGVTSPRIPPRPPALRYFLRAPPRLA